MSTVYSHSVLRISFINTPLPAFLYVFETVCKDVYRNDLRYGTHFYLTNRVCNSYIQLRSNINITNLVNKINLVHNVFLVCLHLSISTFHPAYRTVIHTE